MSTPRPPEPGPRPELADLPTTQLRYLAGRYRLDRVLGQGAMGKVWAAHDEALNRWVAIKEVDFPPGTPASEVDQVAERAMREARAIASVSDHHVVTIFDLLHIGRAPAIVMELLDARSLAEILSRDGPVGDAAAATVGNGVAAGLLAAHAAGITHRDVKPGNVLLCRDGRIKLTDFGIARSVGENTLTATGLLLGSPAYISPEVASGQSATTLSDAWGLGALLFACVQGGPPFDRGDPLKTLISVVHDPVPLAPAAGRLSGLIPALLVKDPGRRMSVGQAHQILRGLTDDPTGLRLVTHVWRPDPAGPQGGPGAAGPGAGGPGTAGPGAAGPGTAGPGTAGPGAAGHGAAGHGAAGHGAAGHGAAGHGAAGPGAAGPGAAGRGAMASGRPPTPPYGSSQAGGAGAAGGSAPRRSSTPPRPAGSSQNSRAGSGQYSPAGSGQYSPAGSGQYSSARPNRPGARPPDTPARNTLTGAPGLPGGPFGAGLPPPPWASSSSQVLRPLPSQAAPMSAGRRVLTWILVVLVGAAAAAGGYFGVRKVAELTTPVQHSAPAASAAATLPE